MPMKILALLLLFACWGCSHPQPGQQTGEIIIPDTSIQTAAMPTGPCEDSTALAIKAQLQAMLKKQRLEGQYVARCQTPSFYLEGDFNGDKRPDIALLVDRNAPNEKDQKTVIIIFSKDNPATKPVIFGAGKKAFGMDNFDWVGIFDAIPSGKLIEPNWNEDTEDFYLEDEVIPEDKIFRLTADAIFVHQDEACGGGYIYWKNGRYNWMQQE